MSYFIISIFIILTIVFFVSIYFTNFKKPKSQFIYVAAPIYLLFYMISITIISFIGFSGRLTHIFGKDSSFYSLPENLKVISQKFIDEGTKRNVNISKIYKTKFVYLEWTDPLTPFNGLCNREENIIYLPKKDVSESLLFHELGHCVLDYNHYYEEKNKDQIMYYTAESEKVKELTPELLDAFFLIAPKEARSEYYYIWMEKLKLIGSILISYFLLIAILKSLLKLVKYIEKRQSSKAEKQL